MFGGAIYLALGGSVALASTCLNNSTHWYVQATSGCCAVGTTINTTVPANWSAVYPSSTSDIAAWIIDTANGTNCPSIEGGYLTGNWPYQANSWTNGLVPYYTNNNGGVCSPGCTMCQWNSTDYLTASTNYYFSVVEGTPGYFEAGWNTPQDWRVSLNYSVPSGVNYSQPEVTNNSNTWMGYGPGSYEPVAGSYCLGSCTSWANWGYIGALCNNSPYLSEQVNSNTYGARGPN